MRRYFKEVRESGRISRFSREEKDVGMELENLFGLIPGSITEKDLNEKRWSDGETTVIEISEEAYNDEHFVKTCEFYAVGEYTPSMAY